MTEWVILWEIFAAVLIPLGVNDVAVLKAGSALSRSVHFMFFFSFKAINNLQSTFYGFGFVNSENVFKVSCCHCCLP